jgi:hypothetical protein
LAAGIVAVAGYSVLIGWFAWTDFYGSHFFDRGAAVALYNLMRVLFIGAIAWLVYAPGAEFLMLIASPAAVRSLRPGERYALGFFTGAGLWHVVLFGIGLVGGYIRPIALGLTVAVIGLSASHLVGCISEARQLLPGFLGRSTPVGARNARFLVIFAVVALLFLCIKVLYPGGGNDYYTHYFYYYLNVVHHGSLMPNEVWYHFYYSKGTGLYFLAMLLTDPLAPQLVTAGFIFTGALTVALILGRVAPGTSLAWVGAILYLALLIFTPSPPDLVGAAGWAELAKGHELSAALFLGAFWISTRLGGEDPDERRIWLTAALGVTAAMVLVATEMAIVAGAFFVALAVWGLATGSYRLNWAAMVCATVAGILLAVIAAINYALTGIPLDQLLLYVWPIVDLEKVARWGVLSEVLWTHFGMTGFARETVPLGWGAAHQLYRDLRLDLWWPVAAFGAGGSAFALAAGEWRGKLSSSAGRALLVSALTFVASFAFVAAVLGADNLQALSFYRFSSFAYAPILCVALLLCTAFPYPSRTKALVAGTVIAALVISGETGKHGRMMLAGIPMLTGDAASFLAGRTSLKEAYQRPGWPGRYSWGGIYPAMEQVWRIVGRGTPVYSLHVQSYCMLPDCRVLRWMDTRTVPDFGAVLFGTPDQAVAAIKQAGIDYFFYSTELAEPPQAISSPIILSPIFAPGAISDYFGVKWSDGTSYLMTWRNRSERPLDADFLETYRRQVEKAPIQTGFPLADWRSIFAHFRDNGLHPYRLPWSSGGTAGG